MTDSKGAVYEFDNFRLEVNERLLMRDGQPVELSSKAFDLLLALVENSGRLVQKQTLYNRVWAAQFVEDANLTVQMSAIRKALGNNAYIKTVKGHGYRFVADVREKNGQTEEYIVESKTISRVTVEHETEDTTLTPVTAGALLPQAHQTVRPRALMFALAGLTLAVLLGIGGYIWRSGVLADKTSAVSAFHSGSIKRLTSTGRAASAIAISPDGKLFAYSQFEGEMQSLWLGHVDGGEPIKLRMEAEMYRSVTFAPDGGSLLYTVAGKGLFRIPVFGGAAERLSENIFNKVTFAPDGRRIAFVRNADSKESPSIFLFDIQTGKEESLASAPTTLGFEVNSPAWSPDGRVIAVGAPTAEGGTHVDVFIISTVDRSIEKLTSTNWKSAYSLAWLNNGHGMIAVSSGELWYVPYPDGKPERLMVDLSVYDYAPITISKDDSLLFPQTQEQSSIWVAADNDFGKAQQITFSSLGRKDGWFGIEWTRENKIIFTAKVDKQNVLFEMNVDGSDQQQLTPLGQDGYYPSTDDNGRFVVFESTKSGRYAVWRMGADASDPRQLTNSDIAAQPHISPDGNWIVYIDNREGFGTLYRIPAEGGEPVRLTDNEMCWVRVSPDSGFIAGGYRDGGKTKLAVLPIDGGAPIKVFDVPRLTNFRLGVRWSPDGKFIAYRDWANGIWKQKIEGGEPERVAGLPEEKIYSFGWSRDGKQFAFTRGQEIRDVVLIKKGT